MMDLERARELRRVKRALDLLDGGQTYQAKALLVSWYRGACQKLAHAYADQIVKEAEAEAPVELPPAHTWLPTCRP